MARAPHTVSVSARQPGTAWHRIVDDERWLGRLMLAPAILYIALLIGVPLGLVMALNRLIHDLLDPLIELLRPVSGIAWIPIGLFIFGVGNTLPTAIMFYGAFFPIVINTMASVKAVDRNYVNAALTLGAGRATVLRHVIFPAALPGILVGARLGAGAG